MLVAQTPSALFVRYPLPYAYARTHQLLLEDEGATLTLWLNSLSGSGASSVSEVMRKFDVKQIKVELADLLPVNLSVAAGNKRVQRFVVSAGPLADALEVSRRGDLLSQAANAVLPLSTEGLRDLIPSRRPETWI